MELGRQLGTNLHLLDAITVRTAVALLHGETDTTVGPYNTHNLANRMRELGGRVEDRYYPGVDHIDAIIALTSMFSGRAPVLADINAFIAKTRAEPR